MLAVLLPQLRLARKAELARESRRRKKLYVHDLEEKVKQLAQKVDEMQRKHSKNPAPNNEEKERTDNQARCVSALVQCDVTSERLAECRSQFGPLITLYAPCQNSPAVSGVD